LSSSNCSHGHCAILQKLIDLLKNKLKLENLLLQGCARLKCTFFILLKVANAHEPDEMLAQATPANMGL
jgi:hypothetical protein